MENFNPVPEQVKLNELDLIPKEIKKIVKEYSIWQILDLKRMLDNEEASEDPTDEAMPNN